MEHEKKIFHLGTGTVGARRWMFRKASKTCLEKAMSNWNEGGNWPSYGGTGGTGDLLMAFPT